MRCLTWFDTGQTKCLLLRIQPLLMKISTPFSWKEKQRWTTCYYIINSRSLFCNMYGNICESLFHQTILVCFVDRRNETEACNYGRIHSEEFYIGCTRHRLCLPVWRRRLSVRCCKNSLGSLCCVLICWMCSARGTADLDSEMSWYLQWQPNTTLNSLLQLIGSLIMMIAAYRYHGYLVLQQSTAFTSVSSVCYKGNMLTFT